MTAELDRRTEPVTVGFMLIPDFPLMAYAAAIEPLRAANQLAGTTLYRWWHASPDGRPVAASNGVAVLPDVATGDVGLEADRVFVCAGGNPSLFDDRRVSAWLRGLARRGVAVGGISGGPYVLARAGLLVQRRCTLHWEHINAFQESFPDVAVARSLFEIDGGVITCSGGIAALDLMLHLVARDHGPALATAVSDWFLHNQMREGEAPQRMALPLRFGVRDPRLLRTLQAMEDNLASPLSGRELAAIACVSKRQLERLFAERLGRTVHRHYLLQRVQRANALERETSLPVLEISQATGFASVGEMRRAQRRAAAKVVPALRG